MKRIALFLFIVLSFPVLAQDTMTAVTYFDTISEQFAVVNDMQAELTITKGDLVMTGHLQYKKPDLLRIDFTDPKDQVINVDGNLLLIYLPGKTVALSQRLSRKDYDFVGYGLFKQGYSIAYETGPVPEPLEEGSEEMVIKLRLEWKSVDEAFRQIIMAVDLDGYIRRITGITKNFDEMTFDLEHMVIDQGIPNQIFIYDSPADAYEITDFIFPDE